MKARDMHKRLVLIHAYLKTEARVIALDKHLKSGKFSCNPWPENDNDYQVLRKHLKHILAQSRSVHTYNRALRKHNAISYMLEKICGFKPYKRFIYER